MAISGNRADRVALVSTVSLPAPALDMSAVSLPAGSVLVAVDADSDLWAYGACAFCLTELGRTMCGCDATVQYVCVTADGAVTRGLPPILTAALPAPRVGLHKLWKCCRTAPVAKIIMMTSDGARVIYPACSACAHAYNRGTSADDAAELYGLSPVSAPIVASPPAPAVSLVKASVTITSAYGVADRVFMGLPAFAAKLTADLLSAPARDAEITWQADRVILTFDADDAECTFCVTYALPDNAPIGAIRCDVAVAEITRDLNRGLWG